MYEHYPSPHNAYRTLILTSSITKQRLCGSDVFLRNRSSQPNQEVAIYPLVWL
ncbi:unnamed protein product [Haemonchus placei]|uniref:Uncharacterized protein n=1 Tax=Haemonchus placei TaxID=6290 RepID=A0A3P7ZE06_HAEPC|nr:unnamed protein product [Haemonchus placei]